MKSKYGDLTTKVGDPNDIGGYPGAAITQAFRDLFSPNEKYVYKLTPNAFQLLTDEQIDAKLAAVEAGVDDDDPEACYVIDCGS